MRSMQRAVACILLLAVCCPILVISKKVVLSVPHQIRRSPAHPSRPHLIHPPSYHAKRSYYPNSPKRPYAAASVHYGKLKPYGYDKSKLPHGGDDFDQGHENIRHHLIPHGKGISHGISYGRGYIPYNKIKSDFPRFPTRSESKPADLSYFHQSGPGPTATEALHAGPSSSQFIPSNYDYTRHAEVADQPNIHSSDSAIDPSDSINFIANKGDSFKPSTFFQNVQLPAEQTHQQSVLNSQISGNQKGVVLSDSILLEDYQKKIDEFTNSWPKIVALSGQNNNPQGNSGPMLGSFTGSVAQNKQNYAVHENAQEPQLNYQRGVVSSPFQIGQTTKNVDVSSLISVQG